MKIAEFTTGVQYSRGDEVFERGTNITYVFAVDYSPQQTYDADRQWLALKAAKVVVQVASEGDEGGGAGGAIDQDAPSNGNSYARRNGAWTALGTASAANTTAFDAAGTATSAVASHVGAANPHTQYAQTSSLADVATSGAYADLTGLPSIPATAPDVGAVPTTRTVNAKALSSDIVLDAEDVGALPVTANLVRIEVVDEYPGVEEPNVLYFLTGAGP